MSKSNTILRWTMLTTLLVSLVVCFVAVVVLYRSQLEVNRANTVIAETERLLSSIKDVETGYRGYMIAADDAYLAPYDTAVSDIGARYAALRTVTREDAEIDAGMSQLRQAIDRKLAYAASLVELQRRVSPMAARERFRQGDGKRLMDDVRSRLAAVSATAARDAEQNQSLRMWPATLALAVGLMGAMGATMYFIAVASRLRRLSQKSAQLMADVIGRSPVGVALVDRQGRIEQANASFLDAVGLPQQEGKHKLLSELAPDVHAALAKPIQVAASGFRATWKSQPSTPMTLTRGDKTLYLTASLFPVELGFDETTGTDGRGVGIVVADITRQRLWEMELEEAREEADAANRAKSAFIANMSHELRTPLTAVLGYSELLEEEIRDIGAESLLGDLGKISMNAKHLLGLINDVLDLSKIEAQKMDVNAIEFSIDQLLEEIDAAPGGLMEAKGNRFVIDRTNAPDAMYTDDLKLKQIILNLISNSSKFTENGTVTLKIDKVMRGKREMTQFRVIDTGIGMSKEQLARLFERFRQADETTTRKYGGTGLGLALTRGLTILLQGTVNVESEPGTGTTFTVEVPTRHVTREVMLVEDKSGTPQDVSGAILVVDDDASVRDVMERILIREGFKVISAQNGEEALEKARTLRPAAILLDVMLPVIDGWNVLKALREDAETADIPVIMQTLLDEERFAYAHGANGYLKKPVRRNRLIEAIIDATHGSGQVMLIDDDPSARERMARLLRRDDWTVIEKSNGREALDALSSLKPDLILVDLVMPEMDGHAFIRHVRANPELSRIPIIVLTAEDIGSADVRQLETFAADIIQKGSMPLADLVANLRQYTLDDETDETAADASPAALNVAMEK